MTKLKELLKEAFEDVPTIDRKQTIEDSLEQIGSLYSQDDDDLDLDAMWDNTVWNEITDIAEEVVYEIDNITATAGVRGAEAEDEALALLYYRRSMKGLSRIDLERALGKLILKKEKLDKSGFDDSDSEKIDGYIFQLKKRLKNA